MPVEDIDFLYQNSTQENIVMLIDTSKRDMSIHPNVGEFQITFDEPFTNVYGIEILDTTIPRTMFMVETGINDSLIYRIGLGFRGISTEYTVYLHTQDFTHSDQLFNNLQFVFNKQSHFEEYPMDVSNNDIYYRQEILVDEYYDRTKADFPLFTFRMDRPFLFDMTKSLLFDTIGFNCIPTSKHSDKYNTIHSLLNTRTNISKVTDHGGAPIYTNVAEPTETVDNFIYTHDSIIMESFLVNICDSDGVRIQCLIKWIDDEGALSEYIIRDGIINLILIKNMKYTIITDDVVPPVSIKYCEFFDVSEFYKNRIFLSKANIDYDDIVVNTQTTRYLEVTTIDQDETNNTIPRVTTMGQDNEDSDRKFMIYVDNVYLYYPGFTVKKLTITLPNYTSGNTFVLKVHHDGSFLMDVILKRNVDTSLLEYTNKDTTHFNTFFWDQYTYTFQLFDKNFEITSHVTVFKVIGSFVGNYSLTAPGIINLAAENYIIMRCDEIENHIRGSHSTDDQSPGLGVLNIGVQGYAEGKNEFVSVKYKEFHPIGRLSKMNFRFERKSDGNIYDFKNINLHFLLSVKFFRPTQKTKFQRSVLNPEYDMNFMSYTNNSVEYEEDVSSDEEDYEDSDYESNLNQRENMLLRHLRT
jgi:hypothetical protein